jgi:hypothetical protein
MASNSQRAKLMQAFEDGNAAFHAGRPITDNPHSKVLNPDRHGQWNEGWRWGDLHAN